MYDLLYCFVAVFHHLTPIQTRLIKVIDAERGNFQDYAGHDEAVLCVRYSHDGEKLFVATRGSILIYRVV